MKSPMKMRDGMQPPDQADSVPPADQNAPVDDAAPTDGNSPVDDAKSADATADETVGAADDLSQEVTPEEQAQYTKFVEKGLELIYDTPQVTKGVIEMLKGGGDPVEGLARASSKITARVANMADQAGDKLDPIIVLKGGIELLEELADLSRTAKIKDFSQDRRALEAAVLRAVDQFRMLVQDAGEIDQPSAQAAMTKLEEMSGNGQLEKIMTELAARDEADGAKIAGPAAGQEEPPPPPQRGKDGFGAAVGG